MLIIHSISIPNVRPLECEVLFRITSILIYNCQLLCSFPLGDASIAPSYCTYGRSLLNHNAFPMLSHEEIGKEQRQHDISIAHSFTLLHRHLQQTHTLPWLPCLVDTGCTHLLSFDETAHTRI